MFTHPINNLSNLSPTPPLNPPTISSNPVTPSPSIPQPPPLIDPAMQQAQKEREVIQMIRRQVIEKANWHTQYGMYSIEEAFGAEASSIFAHALPKFKNDEAKKIAYMKHVSLLHLLYRRNHSSRNRTCIENWQKSLPDSLLQEVNIQNRIAAIKYFSSTQLSEKTDIATLYGKPCVYRFSHHMTELCTHMQSFSEAIFERTEKNFSFIDEITVRNRELKLVRANKWGSKLINFQTQTDLFKNFYRSKKKSIKSTLKELASAFNKPLSFAGFEKQRAQLLQIIGTVNILITQLERSDAFLSSFLRLVESHLTASQAAKVQEEENYLCIEKNDMNEQESLQASKIIGLWFRPERKRQEFLQYFDNLTKIDITLDRIAMAFNVGLSYFPSSDASAEKLGKYFPVLEAHQGGIADRRKTHSEATPAFVEFYRVMFRAKINLVAIMKGFQMLAHLADTCEYNWQEAQKILLTEATKAADSAWVDFFEIETEPVAQPGAQDVIDETEEEEPIDDVEQSEDIASQESETPVEQSPWKTARRLIASRLSIACKRPKSSRIARDDALYHFDVFASASSLHRQGKGSGFSQFALLRSSALAAEQALTAQSKAHNASAPYTHLHQDIANTLTTTLTERENQFIKSVNGCGVYHRYMHHSQLRFGNDPLPNTLKWLLQPQLFNQKICETYIKEAMLFLTRDQSLADSALMEEEVSQLDSKQTYDNEIALIKELQTKLSGMRDRITLKEINTYLKQLQEGLQSLTAFPQACFFLAHVDGILTTLQLIDEQLETAVYAKNHENSLRIHDLNEYRTIRHHAETPDHQIIVDGLNIQKGAQYPHKWLAESNRKQEAIDLRFKAAEITRLNNDDVPEDFQLVASKDKGKRAAPLAITPNDIKQRLLTMVRGCLEMAKAKASYLTAS